MAKRHTDPKKGYEAPVTPRFPRPAVDEVPEHTRQDAVTPRTKAEEAHVAIKDPAWRAETDAQPGTSPRRSNVAGASDEVRPV